MFGRVKPGGNPTSPLWNLFISWPSMFIYSGKKNIQLATTDTLTHCSLLCVLRATIYISLYLLVCALKAKIWIGLPNQVAINQERQRRALMQSTAGAVNEGHGIYQRIYQCTGYWMLSGSQYTPLWGDLCTVYKTWGICSAGRTIKVSCMSHFERTHYRASTWSMYG